MKNSFSKILFVFILVFTCLSSAKENPGISVNINKNSGDYNVSCAEMNWSFSGSVNSKLNDLQRTTGHDGIGTFNEIIFKWNNDIGYTGKIKWYKNNPVVIFTYTLKHGSGKDLITFPLFTGFPSDMHKYSFANEVFAPPQFKLNQTSTPWLFFNDSLKSFIISPASDFMVSKMIGDGIKMIGSGLNEGLKNIPDNFSHSTILVISGGIGKTWDVWGKALRAIYKRRIPANDEGPVLKYYGYWTDNGADYYYNYDTTLGYENTLLKLRKRYDEEGIPIGYMQLDSWWYDKSIYDPNGKPDADHKNPKLPYGKWNRYGGMMSYTADAFLFPKGLSWFQQELNLPLVTHNRWIDPHSPYHDKYKISGFAAIDQRYWDHIIKYIKDAGVSTYEQDWLNYIYNKSPEMAADLNVGNEFTGDMAEACRKAGLTMQYCMAQPRYFLQGLKYNNLTTIRTSGDRFEPKKWKHFLYTSQLAYECGIYPWCDVFKSGEQGNMILSVLSAGPVGTGDAIGKENKSLIMTACRSDGVLIKPDVPAIPVDSDYLKDAEGKNYPMLAYTYTKHGSITTGYVFAFTNDSSGNMNVDFVPAYSGVKGNCAVYNSLTGKIKIVKPGDEFKDRIGSKLFSYYILAPVTPSGIAFLGDTGKIVPTGKKRIAEIKEIKEGLKIKVLFAKGEDSVSLKGYSYNAVNSDAGKINYNNKTHYFNLVLPSNGRSEAAVNIFKSE